MDAVSSVDTEKALTMHLTMQSFQSGRNNHAKTSSSRKEAGRGRDCPSITLRRSVRATNQVASTLVRETPVDRSSAKPITAGSRLELSATATVARRKTCQRSTVTSQCTTTGFTVILATLVQRKFNLLSEFIAESGDSIPEGCGEVAVGANFPVLTPTTLDAETGEVWPEDPRVNPGKKYAMEMIANFSLFKNSPKFSNR